MLETWLQSEQKPFPAAPRVDAYFPAASMEEARQAVQRCIDRGIGPSLVSGAPGSGKSMLAAILQQHYRASAPLALISGAEIHSRLELLQSVLFEFGLPYRGLAEAELRLALLDYITSRDATQLGAILVVDDADHLTPDLLQDLCGLTSHVRDGNWCLHLVLLGTAKLEELLTSPSLASLQQRFASRSVLVPWTFADTEAYVGSQFRPQDDVPLEADWFAGDAHRKIHELTGGVPRLINQLCEHALMMLARKLIDRLDADHMELAWSDLQQLPPPRTTPASDPFRSESSATEHAIEFGELSEETPADPAAMTDHHEPPEAWPEPPPLVGHFSCHDVTPGSVEAETQLDAIESVVQAMEGHSDLAGDTASRPAIDGSRAFNPFAEAFVEEEIVVDRVTVGERDRTLPAAFSNDEECLAADPLHRDWPQEPCPSVEANRHTVEDPKGAADNPSIFWAPADEGHPLPNELNLPIAGDQVPPCPASMISDEAVELQEQLETFLAAANPLRDHEPGSAPNSPEHLPSSDGTGLQAEGPAPSWDTSSDGPRSGHKRRYRRLFSRLQSGA